MIPICKVCWSAYGPEVGQVESDYAPFDLCQRCGDAYRRQGHDPATVQASMLEDHRARIDVRIDEAFVRIAR